MPITIFSTFPLALISVTCYIRCACEFCYRQAQPSPVSSGEEGMTLRGILIVKLKPEKILKGV